MKTMIKDDAVIEEVRRVRHETGDDVIGIVGIADRVRAAKQHLKRDVRNFFTQQIEPRPRVFATEAHRGVEGRAAPHFQRKQLRRATRNCVGDLHHVVGSHPRCE